MESINHYSYRIGPFFVKSFGGNNFVAHGKEKTSKGRRELVRELGMNLGMNA